MEWLKTLTHSASFYKEKRVLRESKEAKMIESLGIIPYSQKAYNKKNSTENKKEYTDIICTSYAPYFPSCYLGTLKAIYIDKL